MSFVQKVEVFVAVYIDLEKLDDGIKDDNGDKHHFNNRRGMRNGVNIDNPLGL